MKKEKKIITMWEYWQVVTVLVLSYAGSLTEAQGKLSLFIKDFLIYFLIC